MSLSGEMAYAIGDVHRYFKFEELFFKTQDEVIKRHTAKMMMRKVIDIFPDLNTREQRIEVKESFNPTPRLIK